LLTFYSVQISFKISKSSENGETAEFMLKTDMRATHIMHAILGKIYFWQTIKPCQDGEQGILNTWSTRLQLAENRRMT
jgi:hypothetical protein